MPFTITKTAKDFAKILTNEGDEFSSYAIYNSIAEKEVSDIASLEAFSGAIDHKEKEKIDQFFRKNKVELKTNNRKTREGVFLISEKDGKQNIVRGIVSKEATYAIHKLQAIDGHENYIVDCSVVPVKNHPELASYMIAEVLPHGNVKDYFDKLAPAQREEETKKWLPKILELINFLHANNIAFPDLKLSNLFFSADGKRIIIADPKSLFDLNIENGYIVPANVGCSDQYLPLEIVKNNQLQDKHKYLDIHDHLLNNVVSEMMDPSFKPDDASFDSDFQEAKKYIEEALKNTPHFEGQRDLSQKLIFELEAIFESITTSSKISPEKERKLDLFVEKLGLLKEEFPQRADLFSKIEILVEEKLENLIDQERKNLKNLYPNADGSVAKQVYSFSDSCGKDQKNATFAQKKQILYELCDTKTLCSGNYADAAIYQEKYKDSPRALETKNIAKSILKVLAGAALVVFSLPLVSIGIGIFGVDRGAKLIKEGLHVKPSSANIIANASTLFSAASSLVPQEHRVPLVPRVA